MKIINLKAENVKKIKAVDITPKDNTVVITGKNGQGKSSVLDSILYALGGKKALEKTPKPVRDGEDTASVTLDLGEYEVVRTWNALGTTRLEVNSKEAGRLASPQALLDSLVGSIAFDPLEFGQMKPADQKAALLEILGISEEVEKLQVEYSEKYTERREVGRDLKKAEGHLASISLPENAPKKAVDTGKVSEQLREAEAQNRRIDELTDDLEGDNQELAELEARIKELKAKIKKDSAKLKTLSRVDTSKLQSQLSNATELNEAYRLSVSHGEASKEVEGYKAQQTALTEELDSILSKKEKLITSAKLPIKGLNIDSEGITFNDIPFTQLSSAEQLKVSLAIAMAMNPKLRVIRIMDGSLLDSENMKIVSEMASKEDYQVWVERVEDGGKVGILIEDGQVKD